MTVITGRPAAHLVMDGGGLQYVSWALELLGLPREQAVSPHLPLPVCLSDLEAASTSQGSSRWPTSSPMVTRIVPVALYLCP